MISWRLNVSIKDHQQRGPTGQLEMDAAALSFVHRLSSCFHRLVPLDWGSLRARVSAWREESGVWPLLRWLLAGWLVLPSASPFLSTHSLTHGSSLSVDGAQTTNSMVTQDTDKLFIQVRPPSWRNTYVLRLVVLICVERIWSMTCLLRDPCPSLYILKGQS